MRFIQVIVIVIVAFVRALAAHTPIAISREVATSWLSAGRTGSARRWDLYSGISTAKDSNRKGASMHTMFPTLFVFQGLGAHSCMAAVVSASLKVEAGKWRSPRQW